MVTTTARYEGQLHCTIRHGPSGATIATDAPLDNHGKGEAFSPTDLVGAALASCTLTIMGIVAQREGIALDGATAVAEKGMVATPKRRIGSLPLRITVPGRLTAEQRQKLEAAARGCPVHASLHPDIQAPITFVYPDARAGEGDGPLT